MTIEKIANRVLESARAEAKAIVAEASETASRLLDQARVHSAQRAEQAEKEIRAELQQELDRLVMSRRAANKLKLLERKGALLDSVFTAAVERFIGDRTGDYARWLAKQLAAAEGMKGRIVSAAADRKAIEEWLSQRGTHHLELTEESAPVRGGFLLEGAQFDADFSLDTRLAEIRAALLPELADRAFSSMD